jgi:branched-chain amino acid transport system permease protein
VPPSDHRLWCQRLLGRRRGRAAGRHGGQADRLLRRDWAIVSMYLLCIAVVTLRARGLAGKKSLLDV